MEIVKSVGKPTPKKLIKIIVKEISTKRTVIELYPTKANERKAMNMEAMADIEVIRVYE